MEDELLDSTQLDETPEGAEGNLEPEGTQDEIAQPGEGEGVEPRISADNIARDTELKLLRELMMGSRQAPMMQQQPVQAPVDPFTEMFKGRTDEDLMTVADIRKALGGATSQMQTQIQTQMRDMTERVARIRYTDYDDVLENYTAKMIARRPDLMEVINKSADPAETAYLLGRSHPDFIKAQLSQKTNALADKIQKNTQKPRTLSARTSGAPRVSGDDRYNSMSDADFDAELEKITGHR